MILEIKLNLCVCDTFHTADGSERNTEIHHLKMRWTSTSYFQFLTYDQSNRSFIFLNGFFSFSRLIHSVTKIQVYRIFEEGCIAEPWAHAWLWNTSIFREKQTWLHPSYSSPCKNDGSSIISLTLWRDWCVSSFEGSSELHSRSRKQLPKVARQSAFTFRSDFSLMLEVQDRSEHGACEGRIIIKAPPQVVLLALTLPLTRHIWVHVLYSYKSYMSYTHQVTPDSPSAGRQRARRWFSTQRADEPPAPCDHLLALSSLLLYLDSTGATLLFIFPTEVWDPNPSPYFPLAQLKQGSSEWFFFFFLN